MTETATRTLKRTVQTLPCKLTTDEQLERGRQLAGVLEDMHSEDSAQEEQKRAMKSRVAALEAERDRLQLVVSRGQEPRDVETEDVADYKSGRVYRIRMDTRQIVFERALTDEERQEPMPLADAAR